ncbi:hypothetical protein [Cohaesibacter gelatinilyticus]|uniref:Uncharacterized protein n=1 Tax=Cohaesibacter gelatinilyticus TaxID=372072 RepID=A0A285NCM1_9HYPH|nr:hypothetical protein [Cohaesibacter gelatinilyticus]SNZ07169.1 hypothetical protein SAMN06265368_0692 [Cohaesibacter gelatinilyticus]
MKPRGSNLLIATILVMTVSSSNALAGNILTPERMNAIEKLGQLTGIGLFCGHHDAAIPLKEVVIEVADKHHMDEATRAKLGNAYHSTRDKAFNSGKQGDYECPKLQQFQSEALLAKLNVSQAF